MVCLWWCPARAATAAAAGVAPVAVVQVVVEGDPGDYFYIIKDGEAVVYQATPTGHQIKVNHLFKADFFGERALLVQEPRIATVGGWVGAWVRGVWEWLGRVNCVWMVGVVATV